MGNFVRKRKGSFDVLRGRSNFGYVRSNSCRGTEKDCGMRSDIGNATAALLSRL
jgi:hypothetical protein